MNNNKADRLIRQKVHAFEQNADAADVNVGLLWEKLEAMPGRKTIPWRLKIYRWAAALLILVSISAFMLSVVNDSDHTSVAASQIQVMHDIKNGNDVPTNRHENIQAPTSANTEHVNYSELAAQIKKSTPKEDNAAELIIITDPATAGLYVNADIARDADTAVDQYLICY